MKTILVVLAAAAALSGCIVAPIEPAPVVVAPRSHHHHGHHGEHRHHRHRHWR